MAIDEAMLLYARSTGVRIARIYTWSEPTISLGRNQRAVGAWDFTRGQPGALPIVRRLTGGRAVLHHREITYSIASPSGEQPGVTPLYRDINEVLLDALTALGVEVQIAPPRGRMPVPASAPCFELPAPGEITAAGRKLVGSAQVREEGTALQHGSILVHDDQGMLQAAAAAPLPATPAACLADILGREVEPAQFADLFFAAIRRRWDPDATWLDDRELAPFVEGTRTRYLSDAWTWRR